jgi:hypothetical protein
VKSPTKLTLAAKCAIEKEEIVIISALNSAIQTSYVNLFHVKQKYWLNAIADTDKQ